MAPEDSLDEIIGVRPQVNWRRRQRERQLKAWMRAERAKAAGWLLAMAAGAALAIVTML